MPALWKVGVFNKNDGEGLHGRLLRGVRNLQLLSGDGGGRSSHGRI